MEKAKISSFQLFVLILLFELGSALLLPIGSDAKQNAWLAILIAMIGGFFVFLIFHRLYLYYPDSLPTTYVQKIIGKFLGKFLGILYMVYFLYLSARVLRDFGEMLSVLGYPTTPLAVNHVLMMIVIVYTVRKGIEVLARTGELFFMVLYLLAISGFVLIIFSNLINMDNLKPFLEDGMLPVVKVALTQVIFFPFSEIFVFSMIFPYLNNPRKARITGLLGMALGGINLAISSAINISVLRASGVSRTTYPLLSTIQAIEIAKFLERLDIFFMLALIILGFFKACIFFYAALIGTADIFNIEQPSKLAFPLGFVTLFFSIATASNMTEHIHEGIDVLPFITQLPFQIIIPFIILVIAFFKNRKKKKTTLQ